MAAHTEIDGGPGPAALLGVRQAVAILVVVVIALLAFMTVHHSDQSEPGSSPSLAVEIVHVAGAAADAAVSAGQSTGHIVLTGCLILMLCAVIALGVLIVMRSSLRSQPGVHEFLAWLAPPTPRPSAVRRPDLALLSISRT